MIGERAADFIRRCLSSNHRPPAAEVEEWRARAPERGELRQRARPHARTLRRRGSAGRPPTATRTVSEAEAAAALRPRSTTRASRSCASTQTPFTPRSPATSAARFATRSSCTPRPSAFQDSPPRGRSWRRSARERCPRRKAPRSPRAFSFLCARIAAERPAPRLGDVAPTEQCRAPRRLPNTGVADLGGAYLERRGSAGYLEIRNDRHLNAEDCETLAATETAVDLALLDPEIEVGVIRGAVVSHPRYAGRRVFGAGLNLTHLYRGLLDSCFSSHATSDT